MSKCSKYDGYGRCKYFRLHSRSIRTECQHISQIDKFVLLLFFIFPFLICWLCWVPFNYCRAKNKKLPLVDSSLSASQHQEAQHDPDSDDATIGSMIRWTHSAVVYIWIDGNLNLRDAKYLTLINSIIFSFASLIPQIHLIKPIPFLLTEVEKRRGYPHQSLKGMNKTIKSLQTTQTWRILHQEYCNIKKLCMTIILMTRP